MKTSSETMIFSIKWSVVNRKKPEPQFGISAPARGDNLISTPPLSAPPPQDCG
jgi:hypothetical protein